MARVALAVGLGVQGVRGALFRYRSATTGFEARVALGEALWWCAAADEYLRGTISLMSGKSQSYYATTLRNLPGSVLGGLVYLRNRAGHQLAACLSEVAEPHASYTVVAKDGTSKQAVVTAMVHVEATMSARVPPNGYRFPPRNALPQADIGFAEKVGRDLSYDACVANRRPEDVLEYVLGCLDATIKVTNKDGGVDIHLSLGIVVGPAS